MFTGIVEEMGVLKSIRKGAHSAILEIQAKVVLEDIHLGDSIAVNGVCLTATSFSPTGFTADVMHETLNRSSLASLRPGQPGQSGASHGRQRPLRRTHRVRTRGWHRYRPAHPKKTTTPSGTPSPPAPEVLQVCGGKRLHHHRRHQPHRGRVWTARASAISAIPHTVSVTVLADRKPGDIVNLETDIIGKYVEKLLHFPQEEAAPAPKQSSGITKEFLTRYGY